MSLFYLKSLIWSGYWKLFLLTKLYDFFGQISWLVVNVAMKPVDCMRFAKFLKKVSGLVDTKVLRGF
jgi:hypothetical protein